MSNDTPREGGARHIGEALPKLVESLSAVRVMPDADRERMVAWVKDDPEYGNPGADNPRSYLQWPGWEDYLARYRAEEMKDIEKEFRQRGGQ